MMRAIKSQGAKHFKIALDLGFYPRAVNDRVPGGAGRHFIDRKLIIWVFRPSVVTPAPITHHQECDRPA